jgi:hypothetical protein
MQALRPVGTHTATLKKKILVVINVLKRNINRRLKSIFCIQFLVVEVKYVFDLGLTVEISCLQLVPIAFNLRPTDAFVPLQFVYPSFEFFCEANKYAFRAANVAKSV